MTATMAVSMTVVVSRSKTFGMVFMVNDNEKIKECAS